MPSTTRGGRSLTLSLAGVIAVAVATTSSPASAAPSAADAAAAETMFRDGKALAAAGRNAEACEKFAESQRLEPATGTLLELAQCDERAGRLASAWAEYTDAASAAQKATPPRPDRVKFARGGVARVEPKMAHLTIRVPEDVKAMPGLALKRDGALVGPGAMGEPIPVDPGPHTIEATAPGRVTWTESAMTSNEAAPTVVDVPPLAEAATSPPPAADLRPEPARSFWTLQRDLGLAAAGAGVASVVVGSVFGAQAASSWSSFKSMCNPSACANASARPTYDDARSDGTLSTVFIIAGAVAVAGGATLFFLPTGGTAKAGASAYWAPYAGPGGGGMNLRGTF